MTTENDSQSESDPEFDEGEDEPEIPRGAGLALFSPCGRYIAIAMENNTAVVVDTWIPIPHSEGGIMVLRHESARKKAANVAIAGQGGENELEKFDEFGYGVTTVAWLDGNTPDRCKNILITGGADGTLHFLIRLLNVD